MNQEKAKQIASHVVLAQHGNKEAMRTIYIQYYKNIFFICKSLVGSAPEAMKLTAEIFTKMFSSVDKLSDHMAFEPWFYSLAINLCKPYMPEDSQPKGLVSDAMRETAEDAVQAVKSKDKYTFEHSVSKLIGEMINTLPNEAKIIFFYADFASLDTEQIALLEKEETETVENGINAVKILFEKQTQKIKELGVDVSPFMRDMESTLAHLAARTFVPDGVHGAVSEKIGINVDPFADKPKAENEKQEEFKETKPSKPVKKNPFSKGDLILFLVVLIIGVFVFSGVKIYRSIKDDEKNTTTQAAETVVRPVVTWNGAAASSFDSGSGTEADPYIIANGAQLAYLANLVNSGNSRYATCHYKLGCDIVLNDTANYANWSTSAPENKWTPIGNGDGGTDFGGTFDGNGFTVSGMYVTGDNAYSGLFGSVKNGCIKNLAVSESFVSGNSNCGGIAGYFFGNATLGADIETCSFSGTVTASGDNTGGIVGCIEVVGDENFMSVLKCGVYGKIISDGSNTGGVAGVVYANSGDIKVSNCFSDAQISSKGENAGGVVGCVKTLNGDGSVYTCYNTGAVSGGNDESSGAVTGMLKNENGTGVIGVMYCVALEGTAPTLTGIASADSMSVKSVRTATDAEMKNAETFEMFNFESIWTFDTDGKYAYPVLISEI